MTDTLSLPTTLAVATQRCIDTENTLGAAAYPLMRALCGVRSAAAYLAKDPENLGYRFVAQMMLTKLRKEQSEYRRVQSECEAARVDLVVAMSSALGMCARCGEPSTPNVVGPYCNDCLEDSVPY